ncbi:MAG: hypothetical protein HQK51_16830, partial [Oligoflexia bacterium]|nr:hypothetical protein [Oligoflexia bacterium]
LSDKVNPHLSSQIALQQELGRANPRENENYREIFKSVTDGKNLSAAREIVERI